ncbi:MAG TPA: sensor histidine kinase [Rariglobus sp.]|jgi:signal transduction histidine kinase|nr:sensor histidine kinase [Rariglobus sp.]
MRNALRPLALVLALCVVGSTAALLQTWVHRRTMERQHHTGVVIAPEELEVLRQYRADQQKAFVALVGVSFAALLMVTLIPARRPRNDDPELRQVRKEIKTAEHLALAAATQGQALVRERDVRQRTEQSLQLHQRLVSQTLEEKIRLGRDLHDGTIQSLYATGLVLESARDLLARDPQEAARRLDTALKTINDTILSVRSHIKGLSPDNVRKDSLIAVLGAVAEELRAGRNVVFDYKVDDTAALRVSADQLTDIVPLVREAISNALRHGRANHITLRLHEGDNAVCLLVQDDGCGFKTQNLEGGGHGLANMHARAEGMGGRLSLTSEPGAGTRLVLTLPLQPLP